ncbi:MAG: ATP-dependent RNA helicase RhlE, partial [Arenicella sp.]
MNFASLDLAPDLQKGIEACGYKKMTLIQEQAIVPA